MIVKTESKPTLRQRQAEATRDLITSAAQELFLNNGYTSTTIEGIAEKAGVAASTVYAVFKSKRGILSAIRQTWHGRTQIKEVINDAQSTVLPTQRLDQLALATRRQWELGSEMIAIYTGAAAADPEAAAELAEALEGRHKAMQTFALSLERDLRPKISADEATAILQALCMPEVYNELVRHSGWTADKYQVWLAQALKRELLAD